MKINIHSDRPDLHVAGSLYVAAMQMDNVELVSADRADLVINVDSVHNTGLVKGKKTVYWELDDNLHQGKNKELYDVDQVYIVSKSQLPNYPKGTKALAMAAEPTIHYNWPIFKKEYDIVFIGSFNNDVYNYRREVVQRLSEQFNCLITTCQPQNYPKELSRGKVLLNVFPDGLINTRFFESMAIGCLLQDYKKELDEFAIEGKDYLGFNYIEEAINKVKYILDHEEARQRIVNNARENILRHHTWEHRLKQIVEEVNR